MVRRLATRSALAGAILCCALFAAPSRQASAAGSWIVLSPMVDASHAGTLTLLADGRVLAVGGTGAEMFEPATNAWSLTTPPPVSLGSHTATLLDDGRVLVAGGGGPGGFFDVRNEVWLFEPMGEAWTAGANMNFGRAQHSAVRLLDGRALVVGGFGPPPEVYDPASNTWTLASEGAGGAPRGHTTTLLNDGTVLTAGGIGGPPPGFNPTPQLFQPSTNAWQTLPDTIDHREFSAAQLMGDGTVLVAGSSYPTASAEIYDAVLNTWTPTTSMNSARACHHSGKLPGGHLLMASGGDADGYLTDSAEYYAPKTSSWIPLPPIGVASQCDIQERQTITLLDRRVLYAGWTYVPGTGTTTAISSLVYDPGCDGLDSDSDGLSDSCETDWFSTDPALADTDGDGCNDGREDGESAQSGGRRTPTDPWDFFDVPAPAGPTLGTDGKFVFSLGAARNRVVSLQDVAVVLAYVGRASTDSEYSADNNGDGLPDGEQLDRTPSTSHGQSWRTGAPNGAITMSDVGAALGHVGHICA